VKAPIPDLVTIDEIRAAAARLDGIALRTPMLPFPASPSDDGAVPALTAPSALAPAFLIKAESLQPTGAFKLRGAYSAISALPPQVRARGVVAHSSGNHALAVAYAARALGVPATVVLPSNAPQVKVDAAARLGARTIPCEPNLTARAAAVAELVAAHGYTPIPPFEHRDVIAGQGTIGLEIIADVPDVDLVLCPVGGGGLISGVAAAIAATRPAARVVGVEPELAADARDSLRRRQRVAWQPELTQRTIADALRAEQVGELPLAHLTAQVHDVVTVSEDEIRAAMRALATSTRLVAEPGGAVAVAALLYRSGELPAARRPVAILSGGNVDPALFASVLAGSGGDCGAGGS
jgi:threonine dehydratase